MRKPRWKQLILDAKALIPTEDKWIKGSPAKTAYGMPILPSNPDASKFCVLGALEAAEVRGRYAFQTYSKAWNAVSNVVPKDGIRNAASIAKFNDEPSTTLRDIHTLLDEAVKE